MLTPEQSDALRIVRDLAEEHVPAGLIESLHFYLDEIEAAAQEHGEARVVLMEQPWTLVWYEGSMVSAASFGLSTSAALLFTSRPAAEQLAATLQRARVARLVILPPEKIAAKPRPDREGWWVSVLQTSDEHSLDWWTTDKIAYRDSHATGLAPWQYFGPLDLPQKKEPAK